MHSQSTFLIAPTLILLLMAGQISISGENNVEETNIKPLRFEDNICSLYDNLSVIDSLFFKKQYKPLVIIIADKLSIGVNRVRNFSDSKRILNDENIRHWPHHNQLHQTILRNIFLFQANNIYYFIYPLKFQLYFLTIYFQKQLLNDNSDISFDFVNAKKEFPFFENILMPLQSSCTNCTLVKYINEKLQKGEIFSELFELRKQLFKRKAKKNLSFKTLNNYDICTSMGFNLNSQNTSSFMHFNSLLKQIQSNSDSLEKSKKISTVEGSLTCFQSRNLEAPEYLLIFPIAKNLKVVIVFIDYLNWINNTISSLKNNDILFGGLCENEHKIDIFKLFCFMKEISDVTSHNITEWIEVLKEHFAKSLNDKLDWFNRVKFLYNNEYSLRDDLIFSSRDDFEREIQNESEHWHNVMQLSYLVVKNSLLVYSNYDYRAKYNTICTVYEHWKTIDDLLFEVEFKRLVIIVVDDMKQGIKIANQIRASRVEPKVKREDLHYSEQFLYDFIMKHIYLVQSNDTHYYVYPTNDDRQENPLIGYFEYKMIKNYSNVFFYFVNSRNYFSRNESSCFDDYDSLIHALLDYRDISSGNIQTRFINPSHLIKVHQDFFIRFPEYFPIYASVYNDFTEFVNNYDQHYRSHGNITYFQEFRNFLKQLKIPFYLLNDLFKGLPCSSSQKLNNITDIDFRMTQFSDVLDFHELVKFAYRKIMTINNRDDTNLESLCSNKEIFKFLKFVCFLKINYIEGMLKVIHQVPYVSSYITSTVENEKNAITNYLLKSKLLIEKLLSINYIDYEYNETRMFEESDAFYSQIPKITLNGADLFNKIYSIVRNDTIFSQCKKLGFLDTKEITPNVNNTSTENYLELSKNKTTSKLQEEILYKAQRKKLCLVPS
ncbi:uncharacterized protein LOC122510626 isoform X2 [Leptopilina heterotoma]|uniref:uncharacterized protein LOC122510626 isoform X2 n=1 Tax=Leptopilina heterotoma TaxID=63436 RepID=UPI001CA91312|nr:uncharacterized protein LOC122510626 isoform X2 [Leptopilina heterotoma]